MKPICEIETDRKVIFRIVRGLFQGSDSSFSKGLFDSDTNILRSYFTCKLFAGYFARISVFSVVEIRLLMIVNEVEDH
jgi:hypothetical protein